MGFTNSLRYRRMTSTQIKRYSLLGTLYLSWSIHHDCPRVHILKSLIDFLEVDFSAALNFFLANFMMIIAEENGFLDEYHGLRKNITCTDADMITLLKFECTSAKKSTTDDCKTCFDRVECS